MSRTLHDGRKDGLEPLESLDIKASGNFAEFLERMSRTAFGGRSLGEAFDVLLTMARDAECTKVMTVSGAMTIAKMGRVVCDMIDNGLVDVLISTGAIMAHGLSEATGGVHYKHDPRVPDKQLYEWGYNRVYDTLEMEANLCDAERFVSQVLREIDPARATCSSHINRELGRRLVADGQMPSVLGCAFRKNVPVYVPAFTDSELGLDVATFALRKGYQEGKESDLEAFFSPLPNYNPYLDLYDYARRALGARRLGIFTIGGGVPRNWAQQVGPFVDIINMRLGSNLEVPRFTYGVRICPEPVHWGGLSGCTYSEGVSWGKFLSRDEGGRFAEVHCDATIAWPILVRGVLEALGKL
jgi:deoxyhypusine synthase